MPNKTSKKKPVALPSIPKELIDRIAAGPMTAEAVNAASMAFKKALIERAGRRAQPSLGVRVTACNRKRRARNQQAFSAHINCN